jgi:hypothetical protein
VIEKPLAIDLFCGLFQSKLIFRAYPTVKKLMASRAQNPNHIGFGILREAPRAISLKFGTMRNFEDSMFSTRFTGLRHIWISFFQSVERIIFELTLRFIGGPPLFVFSPSPHFSQFTRGLCRAFCAAISFVGIRRLYREMDRATSASASVFCSAFMLLAADATGALRAVITAPFLIWPDRLEGL